MRFPLLQSLSSVRKGRLHKLLVPGRLCGGTADLYVSDSPIHLERGRLYPSVYTLLSSFSCSLLFRKEGRVGEGYTGAAPFLLLFRWRFSSSACVL